MAEEVQARQVELVVGVHHHLVASKVVRDIARFLKARVRRAGRTTLSVRLPLALLDPAVLSRLFPSLQGLDSAVRPPADSEDQLVGSQLAVELPPRLVVLEDKNRITLREPEPVVLDLEAASLPVRASLLALAVDSRSQAVAFHQEQVAVSPVEREPLSLSPRLSRLLCLLLHLLLKSLVETRNLSRLGFVGR